MKLKYTVLVILITSTLVHFSCDLLTGDAPDGSIDQPIPAFSIQWNDQNSLVCFGTSLTYGYGAGEKKPAGPIWVGGNPNLNNIGDSSYPHFLQEKLKIKVLNKGYTGARTSYALSIFNDSVLSKKPALVLLEFGANDFLQGMTVHTTDSLLSLLVTRIKQTGTQIVLLSFVHPDMMQYTSKGGWSSEDSIFALDYSSMLVSVAHRYSLPHITYPLKGVFGYPNMMSDQFHPNGVGYKRMEENIFNALSLTFEKNGMLK